MPRNKHAVLTGVVYHCPVKDAQVAVHINLVDFTTLETTLLGVEVDLEVPKCPACDGKHSMLVPSQ